MVNIPKIEDQLNRGQEQRKDLSRQIGGRDSVQGVFKILEDEKLDIKDRYIKLASQPIYDSTDDSFILDHSTNGVLGTATGVGGNQVVLGKHYGSKTTERIIIPQNLYREWFYDSFFEDSGNTTAVWDDTNHEVKFSEW